MAYIQFVPYDPDEESVLKVCSVTIFDSNSNVVGENIHVGTFSEGYDQAIRLDEGTYTLWVQAPGFIFAFPTPLTVSDDLGGETIASPQMISLVAESVSTGTVTGTPGICRVWGVIEASLGSPDGSDEIAGYGARVLTPNRTRLNNYETVTIRQIAEGVTGMFTVAEVRPRCSAEGRFEVVLRPDTLYCYIRPGVRGFRYFRTGDAGTDSHIEDLVQSGLSERIYGDFV